jgi:hypothetical protein
VSQQENRSVIKNRVVWLCCNPFKPTPVSIRKNKQLVLGRHQRCDLQLPHTSVSRQHAIVKVVGGRALIIEDRKSSNGTYVNGKKIAAHPLIIGDIIQIGPYEVEVREKPFKEGEANFNATSTAYMTTNRVASMAGQIEKTPLVEVLQSIEFNSKTGTLYVECKQGNDDGFFVFVSGRPISAVFKNLKDIPALLEMLKLREGMFTNILFEFSRIQDERQNHV